MKIRVGCSVNDYFVGEEDSVVASWSVEQFGFTVGTKYKVEGISSTKNLIIKNDNGETREYDPVHFSACI